MPASSASSTSSTAARSCWVRRSSSPRTTSRISISDRGTRRLLRTGEAGAAARAVCERYSMSGVTAVLDIGKTNVKVATFGGDGTLVWERAILNGTVAGPPYPHADVEHIWEFLLGALADANKVSPIAAIVPTTHGCAAALIDDRGLVLPVMDYEFAGVEEIEPLYAPLRPLFSQTFSPPLHVGMNLARQLAWQRQ